MVHITDNTASSVQSDADLHHLVKIESTLRGHIKLGLTHY